MTPDAEALAGLRALLRPVVRQLLDELVDQRQAVRREFVTSAEAAVILGVTPDTVLERIRRGLLPASRPPGARGWLLPRAGVEAAVSAPAVSIDLERARKAREIAQAVRHTGEGDHSGRGRG